MAPIKIHIKKEDDLPVVAERVFSADGDEIVLIVPKFSKLAESADNFIFLKKGLSLKDRTLVVESVDDKVIKMAKKAGFSAENPFFAQSPDLSINEDEAAGDEKQWWNEEGKPADDEYHKKDEEVEPARVGEKIFNKVEAELGRSDRSSARRRVGMRGVVLLLLVAGGVWASVKMLPQAEINIITHKSNWEFSDEVMVDKRAIASDLASLKIPGQIFTQKINNQMKFPASGRKAMKQKATGKILIYNAYSSDPQPLVATTRFQTGDGKIVRINKRVIVPGAKIVNGEIIPSFIEAEVTADKPGADYNLGPIAKLTIPGFKKSAPKKYAGFYGEIKTPLKGGYVGERAYPTANEIAAAKAKSLKIVQDSAKALISSKIPSDFKVLDGSSRFKLLKQEIDAGVNEKNEFSVFTEANFTVLGFREKDLLSVLANKAKEELGQDFHLKSYELNYNLAQADLESGKISLAVDFNAVVEKPIDIKALRQKVAGKSEADLKALIFGLPGLEKAQVSLWPFWVSTTPDRQEKIKINVD